MPSRLMHLPGRTLGLEEAEEAMHGRVVPDLAGPVHAAINAMLIQQLPEVLAGGERVITAGVITEARSSE